jgi:hypothetical protein
MTRPSGGQHTTQNLACESFSLDESHLMQGSGMRLKDYRIKAALPQGIDRLGTSGIGSCS